MIVPEDLALILDAQVSVGEQAQMFPLLTVDERGFPHVAVLSVAELAVAPGRAAVLVALAGPSTTTANLLARRQATLVAVHGTTVHSVKLAAVALHEQDGLLGVVGRVEQEKRDSLGIPLSPMSFPASPELAELERWDRHAVLLDLLATLDPDPST